MTPTEAREPVVLFIGQPNCGKSTLFNAIAGHKVESTNFPGSTVRHAHSRVVVGDATLNIIDLPGAYSLCPSDPAEKVALTHLFREKSDVLINVVDASILGRSLELTLEILEMGLPIVVALNMLDLAEKKGISVDPVKLEAALGVRVVPTIAVHGRGIRELVEAALEAAAGPRRPSLRPGWTPAVEARIGELVGALPADFPVVFNARFTAIRLIESGEAYGGDFSAASGLGIGTALEQTRAALEADRGLPAYEVLAAERHHQAQKIFEETSVVRRRTRRSFPERLDDVLMHPFIGYVVLTGVFLAFFFIIFKAGSPLEAFFLRPLESAKAAIDARWGRSLWATLLDGLLQGVGGGVAIVLPYFIPLLFLMAVLEDAGYLARAGFLLDTFMHRLGLHGKSVSPFVLGFGCNVPAITATRTLESRRDRMLTSLLIPFIPCSARTTIILALVAFYLGPLWAMGFYVANLVLVAGLGRILSLFLPSESPGLILEIPMLKVPSPRLIALKVYLHLKAFVRLAWPLLIGGSVVLSLFQYFRWDRTFNVVLAPLVSGLLGLPRELGVTLIFGFLRKELSLVMLLQALGTTFQELPRLITKEQMVVFTVFVSLFIPCLSTFVTLWKESGRKIAFLSAGLSVGAALVLGFIVRLLV
ncbi:MAG: ferrous iron transport protein B [Candidatus Aminicenantes bacterium]|nr:ferrous iron transport protein B [Candidatus Aminicenantes bacterium]